LIINLCKHKMHALEFVQPVCDILKRLEVDYNVREYFRLKKSDLDVEKVIFCGTSLQDFDYLKNIKIFDWLLDYQGDILGICGGAQILAHLFGGEVYKNKEIGKTEVIVEAKFAGFLGLPEKFFVYSLHNLGIIPPKDFEIAARSAQGVQIMKKEQLIDKKKKMILGVLFHPEVLNHEIIERFALS